jgi:hypothetical protein
MGAELLDKRVSPAFSYQAAHYRNVLGRRTVSGISAASSRSAG